MSFSSSQNGKHKKARSNPASAGSSGGSSNARAPAGVHAHSNSGSQTSVLSSTTPLPPARPAVLRTSSVPSSTSPQAPNSAGPALSSYTPALQPSSPTHHGSNGSRAVYGQPPAMQSPPSSSHPASSGAVPAASSSSAAGSAGPAQRYYHRTSGSGDLPPAHPSSASSFSELPERERRNSRPAFPFPFSPAATPSPASSIPSISPSANATHPPSPPKHAPVREPHLALQSHSPPSTPHLRTFLNERVGGGGGGGGGVGGTGGERGSVTPPSFSSSASSLPPLSLAHMHSGGGSQSNSAPPSAPSSPLASQSRSASPRLSPDSTGRSSFPPSPITSLAGLHSHVSLHVRRSYSQFPDEPAQPNNHRDDDFAYSASAPSTASPLLSTSPHPSGSTREKRASSALVAQVWASPRRDAMREGRDRNHAGPSSYHAHDGERMVRSSLSSSSSSSQPSSSSSSSSSPGSFSLFSVLSQPSLFLLHLQRIRKHYTKPEDKQRPSLQTASLASCFTPSPLSSISSALAGEKPRSGVWRWLVYLHCVMLLVFGLWWWLFSSAPPLSFMLSFYFPSSVSPQSIYFHSPPAAALETETPNTGHGEAAFTIINILDLPTSSDFLSSPSLASSSDLLLRWHALMSWALAVGPINVMVYVEHEQTCNWLIERPELRGLKCFLIPSIHPTYKRPILPSLFEHAHSHSRNQLLAFIARPAFLHPEVHRIVANVSSSLQRFMLVTRRTNVVLPPDTLSPFTFSLFSPSTSPFVVPSSAGYLANYQSLMSPYIQSLSRVFEYADHYGKLHSEYGIDLFIYPRDIFSLLHFPPYLAGVYRWDNWWLSEMILHDDVAVVDLSSTTLPLLTHDGVKTVDHPTEDGAHYNDRITKLRSGNQYKLGHANNADYKLEGRCPHCSLLKNPLQSIAVLLAKRINSRQYLALLTYESTYQDELRMALLHNFVCWAKRIGFTHFIVLVQDAKVAQHLAQHGIPFIHRDSVQDALSPSTSGVSGAADVSDFATFHVEVLRQVLKAGYHFFTGPATSIFLDDPLIYLHRQLDVQLSVNLTSDELTRSAFWAVRATTYGRDFIMKLKDCVDKSKDVPRTTAVEMKCVGDTWRLIKKNKAVKRGALDEAKFSLADAFFQQKLPQGMGVSAVTIDLSDQLAGNGTLPPAAARRVLGMLESWHMMVHRQEGKGVHKCSKPLYPALPPPTEGSSAPVAFSLKIKVLASFRPRSLQSLLRSLQSAVYDDDQVELELCLDGLPAVNPTDKEKAKHLEVKKIIADFVWTQGPLSVTEEKESKKGPGETGDWKGRGAFGTFLTSWLPSASNPHQVLLLVPEYVTLSPAYYQYVKRTVLHYYLDREHYDPAMYGISLQSSMPILGTDYDVAEELPTDLLLYRYQMLGSLGTLLFPQHWSRFLQWMRSKKVRTEHGMLTSLSLLDAFSNSTRASALSLTNVSNPCVPSLASNLWWLAWNDKYNRPVPSNVTLTFAIDHLYPLFFARFLYETGYYALFPHFPQHQQLVVQSEEERVRTIYSWSADKEAKLRADPESKPRTVSTLPFYSHSLPSLASLPLFDLAGWDVNGRLEEDEMRQEEEERLEGQRLRIDGEKDEREDERMSLSRRGNRERSAVLAYRPYQWSHSPQCVIVWRDKLKEAAREASMIIGQLSAPAPSAAVAAQAGVHAPPKGGLPKPQHPTEGDEASQLLRRPVDEDAGEDEAVDRSAFIKRWREGGRGE